MLALALWVLVWSLTCGSFCPYTWSWLSCIPGGCFAPQVNNSCGVGWAVATLLCIYQKDDLNLRLLCSWGSIHQATKSISGFFTLHLLKSMKYSLVQRPQCQGRQLDNPAPKIRFHSSHLNQRVQKLINSPNGTLLIESVCLSASSDFKRKCSIQKQRGNF